METPDRWVVIKITNDTETIYKVLAGWSGGYLGSDSWRLNSGIVGVEYTDTSYIFYGHSGSKYECYKSREGLTGFTASILAKLEERANEATVERVRVEDIVL